MKKKSVLFKPKNKIIENYIVKSNSVTRAVRSPFAGIMTFRIFAFGLAKLSKGDYEEKENYVTFNVNISDFANYFDLNLNQLYEVVKFNKRKMTVIKKEMDIISGFKFEKLFDDEPLDFEFETLFKKCGHRNGKLYFQIWKPIFFTHFTNLQKDFTKFYLAYTKLITSKYTWPLYEYLRSQLFISKQTPKYQIIKQEKEFKFKQLALLLNIDEDGIYFKDMKELKSRVLNRVCKDLVNTDMSLTYELLKEGRKYTKVKFYWSINKYNYYHQFDEIKNDDSKNKKVISK